ncbi:asparagine synthetase B family protein [Sphingopyxis witflariensis]|uniref:asparagine synthase (glutamine-hydrolyzing) n=1 Tax=Sphingopyxis witflariensis TaxID=173675 RepID=A0A246JHC4_9SPHN|nr:asparagine synthetase B family protein [Sphingopyxis witflariensis]OWQ91647.1 hypothetical protein CDQ91_19035 [Sphingopyxis witflariensis]
MRLAFHLDIATSGLAPLRAEASTEEVAFVSSIARLSSPAPIIDLGEGGCIVGPLFRRELPATRVTNLDLAERKLIVETGGGALLADYWGAYIALLIDDNGTASVLRDPSGMMTCYMRREPGRVTLASDMAALAEPGRAKVDYRALARMFAGIDSIGRRSGICDIEELLPGERLIVNARESLIEQTWSPWDHVRGPKGRTFEEAADALRITLKDSIGIWSTLFDNILIGVSGGLDSSIVAAALGPRTPNLRCLTMVEPDSDGDERRYAKALVRKLGIRLEAPAFDLAAVDVRRPVMRHLPLPVAAHYFPAIEAEHRRLDVVTPIDAYFSGNGGDNVFCALRSAAPLADRFLAQGPGPGLFATARDLADLTGSGMMDVVRNGWQRIGRRRNGHRVRPDLTGLGKEGRAAALAEDDRHPWLAAPPGTLPGKAAHVVMLARAQRSIELYPRTAHPPQILPLLSQPIVELCLSIPSWQWVRGGRDRAVARAAFTGILPDLLIERTTKGSPGGFVRRVYDAQGDAARAMLKKGKLVEAGLIDPCWVARTAESDWQGDGRDLRLLSFAAAEAWINWWTDGVEAAS